MSSARNLGLSVLACASIAAIVVACGSDDDSTFNDGTADDAGTTPGVFVEAGDDPNGDLYKNDPVAQWCGPDGGATTPPPIGGTEECPEDKNKPGCPCPTIGATAKCWTGLRADRNVGICKDGNTTCRGTSETGNAWGPCEGQTLPKPNSSGAEACGCFSAGLWKIANLNPCVWQTNGTHYAYSTLFNDSDPSKPGKCSDEDHLTTPGTTTGGSWSTDTLKVDCAGTFRLCFRIRAGVFEAPKGDDCILGETCIDADYVKENVEQEMPKLKPWAGSDSACAKKWETDTPANVSPGYGEMIVKGQSVRCEAIDDGKGGDFVFHRVKYCPRMCREAINQSKPECKDCGPEGQGEF